MSLSTDNEEPINEKLAKMADMAEMEDREPEPETKHQIETREELEENRTEAARHTAAALVNGIAKGVKWGLDVEYSDDKKREGIEVFTPCFEGEGVMPDWAANFFGRYGCYLAAGAFVAVTGFATYQAVQERKAQEEADNEESTTAKEPNQVETYTAPEPTAGAFVVGGGASD